MKYALVTGGSRGLGKAICLEIAKTGTPVIINYQSNETAANEVKTMIEAQGGEATLMRFDVSKPEEVEKALEAWQNEHPDDYIAYLVNNAGIRRDNMMFMMPAEDWAAVLNTSLNGFYYVTRKVLPRMMMRKHGGSIVNMASVTGLKGMPGQTNYGAAKGGIIAATKSLALEVAARNVTVNAVAPGFIESDMTKDLDKDSLVPLIPTKRFGKPEEVAALVGFLVSENARYITGEVISINGGLYT
jgi:3-oxoacyl-[acyl-carrier protein] reductase